MVERILSVIRTPFRKEYRIYSSVIFFMLLASVFLYINKTNYKVSYVISINHPNIDLDSVYSKIKSKSLVQKTIGHLPFEVNYYWKSAPRKEIYGSVLPVKLIAIDPAIRKYGHDLQFNSLSSHFYGIDHEDTIQFYEFDEAVKRYYGHFKLVKGSAFQSHFDPLIVRFNKPEELLDSFHQNLSIDSDGHTKTIRLSVVTANPLKGQAFLDELVHQYNADNQLPGKTYNYQDSLKQVEQKLASLKLTLKPVTASKPDQQQLKTLGVIRPYVEKPVNQFVQVPYTDEVENKVLKNNLEKFNRAQLDKQHFLAATKIDDVAVANADKQLRLLKAEILDQINSKGLDANEMHLLKRSVSRYKELIANQSAGNPFKTTDTITVADKDNLQIEIAGANAVVIYIIAILLGLLLPLAYSFLANLDLKMMRGARFSSQPFAEKLKILFGISQID